MAYAANVMPATTSDFNQPVGIQPAIAQRAKTFSTCFLFWPLVPSYSKKRKFILPRRLAISTPSRLE
jgi:hypothetical protein